VIGAGQKFLTWVGPGQFFVAQVGSGRVNHLWFGVGFGKFPLKCLIFQIFSLRVKKNLFRLGQKAPELKAGRHLIYCGSKVSSGRVGSGLIFLYFKVGQVCSFPDGK